MDGRDPSAIAWAADRLAAGELVAFPTETVYGLGARADDDAAVAKVFAAKGRPADHPLIVHVTGAVAAEAWSTGLPSLARRLAGAFWPGPMTLIVTRAPGLGSAAAGRLPTIGLRCPAHPVAHALLAAAADRGVPGVAAPSANRFGRISPTRAEHVRAEFGGAVPVLDGGDCELGIESAIVDCSRGWPVLLRPGVLTPAQIEAAAGEPLRAPDAAAPRAAGTLEAHYAPRARLRLMSAEALREALERPAEGAGRVAVYSRSVHAPPGVLRSAMPAAAAAAAHVLYAALRELDAAGVDQIWVEAPPAAPEWDGIRDRLRRAANA